MADFVQYEPAIDFAKRAVAENRGKDIWTQADKDTYITKYRDKYKDNPRTVEELKEAGVPDEVIDKLSGLWLTKKAYEKVSGVEADPIADPVTTLIGLPLRGLKAMSNTRKILKAGEGMPQSIYSRLRDKGSAKQIIDEIKTGKNIGLNQDESVGVLSQPMGKKNLWEKLTGRNKLKLEKYYNDRLPTIERIFRRNLDDIVNVDRADLTTRVHEAANKLYKKLQSGVNAKYDVVKKLAKDDKFYDVSRLKENILKELRDEGLPESAVRAVKRSLFYKERNLTPAERGALKKLEDLDPLLDEAAADVAVLLPGRKRSIANANKELAALEHRWKVQGDETAKSKYKQLKEALQKYNSIDKQYSQYAEVLPEVDKLSQKEYIQLIQDLNDKSSYSRMAINTTDPRVQMTLNKAKRMVEDFFEQDLGLGELVTAYKDARKAAKAKIDIFGGYGGHGVKGLREMGNLVDTMSNRGTAGRSVEIQGIAETLANDPAKLRQFSKYVESVDPALGKDLTRRWLNKTIGVIGERGAQIGDPVRMDLKQLATRLSKVVNDPEAMRLVNSQLGAKEAARIQSLYRFSKYTDELVDTLYKEKGGVLTRGDSLLSRLKQFGDELFYGKDLTPNNEMLNKISEIAERRLKAKTMMEKTSAEQMLNDLLKALAVTGAGSYALSKGGING